MNRKAVVFAAGYLVALTALLLGVWLAAPGSDSKEILGLIVRGGVDDSQRVFISNRWIHCDPARWDHASESTCTIDLFSETLEIVATRNPLSSPIQHGGNCTAIYDGMKQTCTIGSYGLNIQWVANVYMGNRINEAQQRALKRRHILGNLPEIYYAYGTLAIPILSALLLGIATYFGLLQTVSTPPKLAHKLSFVVSSVVNGLIGGFLLYIVCMAVTGPFW